MNIVVCIKQVPDTNEIKINPVTGTLIRDGVPSIMNPDDKGGLEMALRLKDELGAHVTVITMGPPQADLVLREAFAMGADRAILLSGREFAGADTLATSNALAGALRTLQFDLLICGRQAIDGDTAQVGPQMAEHLDLPQISYVCDIKVKDEKTVRVVKENEDGHQILEAQMPCLLTCLASAVHPRYMNVAGIVQAYNKEVEVWGVDRIDVDLAKLGLKGSPTKVLKAFAKGLKAPGEVFETDPEEAVGIIISRLKEKFII
ncbi:MAG: electron transfer flavoprotein subunit beta/FixA family protein [Bacteroidales bacterium]|nr:electron transfer flavoprotein subunit beta/FixA family protein [Bacteroidales bacterium]MDY5824715.1 electron transfer flavoprotein subunit beta/FixA family protein [Candidatus Coprenecus sp.]